MRPPGRHTRASSATAWVDDGVLDGVEGGDDVEGSVVVGQLFDLSGA
jgi:hypothetical protein